MKFAVVASAIFVVGCATTPKPCPPSIPKVETVEVVREVQKPCAVSEPTKPSPLTKPLPSKSDALIAILTQKLLQWAGPGGYGERASQAIETCKSPSE